MSRGRSTFRSICEGHPTSWARSEVVELQGALPDLGNAPLQTLGPGHVAVRVEGAPAVTRLSKSAFMGVSSRQMSIRQIIEPRRARRSRDPNHKAVVTLVAFEVPYMRRRPVKGRNPALFPREL